MLLAEVGTGTEPVEGSALGVALLETLQGDQLVKGGRGGAGYTHHRFVLESFARKVAVNNSTKQKICWYNVENITCKGTREDEGKLLVVRLLTRLLTCSLTHSLTHTRSLAHSLAHLLTQHASSPNVRYEPGVDPCLGS